MIVDYLKGKKIHPGKLQKQSGKFWKVEKDYHLNPIWNLYFLAPHVMNH